MDITPTKFFGYCRESIDLESGIKIQKEAIINYARLHGIEIVKWFIDNDSSAYFFRPKYDEMMKAILEDTNTINGIICNTLSRFGRSTTEVLTAKDNLVKSKKELILIKENMDTITPQGKLMFTILVAFNDFEHDLILERTKAGIEHAKKYGTKSGKPMHRPLKNINWKQVDDLLLKKVPLSSIAKIMGVTKKTMYNRIKTRQ